MHKLGAPAQPATVDGPVSRVDAATPTDTSSAWGQAELEVQHGVTVGLDIGGTKVFGIVLSPAGEVLASIREATIRGPEGVVDVAVGVVHKLVAEAGAKVTDLEGVGVGVPGIVDPRTGSVIHAVNVGIDGEPFPLAQQLSERLGGTSVRVDNDLNAAALGASHVMGPDGQDMAFLSLGTGVAAGIVLDGELRHGLCGAAGEIGHIPIDPRGPMCACGQRGCVEVYASGGSLAERWPSPNGTSGADLFKAADAGDEHAQVIRMELAAAIAAAVRILGLSVDVRRIVLGGGVVNTLGEPLLERVRAALDDQAKMSPFLTSLQLAERVSVAPQDVPVAAVGAALVGRRKR